MRTWSMPLLRRRSFCREAPLDVQYAQGRTDESVRAQADRVDASFDQERREVRVVAGRLAANADFATRAAGSFHQVRTRPLYRLVSLVEERGHSGRVPVDAERELRQVIRADGEPVENLG